MENTEYVLLAFGLILAFLCNNSKAKRITEITLDQIADKNDNLKIICILADDLGYGDLGVYGQKKFKAPDIDKLTAHSMLFREYYSGSTVRVPSRSALITGRDTVVRGNKEVRPKGQYPFTKGARNIALFFKGLGDGLCIIGNPVCS